MITNAISRRYAKALVQLGSAEGAIDRFRDELKRVETTLAENSELRAIFGSPAYRVETKREILKGILAKLSVSPTVSNFLLLLVDRNRIGFLPQIVAGYGVLADEFSGIIRPTLTSALPLDDSQVEAIRSSLEKTSGKKVLLSVKIDPSLIGGITTQIGDKVFDGSVRTQLQRIEDTLQKG
ncbi:MAG TPA: ATP synthase F1 subunit delta [Verrucomicrobiae bacterium]|nr:ATP synthase F1 subunit delta [Verrucomicrobiae bacterium]